jgi:formate C-acetyltransferase
MLKAAEVIRLGRGKPKVFVDETAIPMLLKRGVTLEEARDYCVIGCVEVAPSGCLAGWTNAAQFNLAKCFELAMNSGVCVLTGVRVGPKTQDPKTFTSLQEIIEAFKVQLHYFAGHMITTLNAIVEHHAKLVPCPFTSALIDGCLESGKDFTWGGAKYNSIGVNAVAVPDVGDSLAAIETLVFKEKKIDMHTLVALLQTNFEGHEDIRQMLLHRAPKYGNNNDLVDSMVRLAGQIYCKEIESHTGPYGIRFWPGVFTVSANVPLGLNTGSLPSGRKAKTPLADGGISPTHDAEAKGPTSVIQSAAKLDHIAACNGTLLNMRFSPSVLKEERDLLKLVALLRAYCAMGGFHIQFNVIDNKILRDAQKNPHKYRSLMVRVAGYSAYFTELSPEVQEDIISRASFAEVS